MKIQYKDQTFQTAAAKAVVDVFEGQPFASNSYIMYASNVMKGLEFTSWNNNLYSSSGFSIPNTTIPDFCV